MKTLWTIFAWISIICGLIAYAIGWTALITKSELWIPTAFWFYDAVAVGIFGVFFLIYGVHSKR